MVLQLTKGERKSERKVEAETIIRQMGTIMLQITCQFWCNLSVESLSNSWINLFFCFRCTNWLLLAPHQPSTSISSTSLPQTYQRYLHNQLTIDFVHLFFYWGLSPAYCQDEGPAWHCKRQVWCCSRRVNMYLETEGSQQGSRAKTGVGHRQRPY